MTKRLFLTTLLVFILLIIQIDAQGDDATIELQVGDPPIAERISLLPSEDDPYSVRISGEAGAVFPSAQVAIRNLYTGATTYTQANFDGSFSSMVTGIPELPYQIQVDTRFDQTINPEILSGIGVILHPSYEPIFGQGIPFGLAGSLSYGAGTWYAEGAINAVDFVQGDRLSIALDVTFLIDNFDPSLDYVMRGELGFRRYFDENGTQLSTAIGTGDTWSSEQTPTGLPILGRTVPDAFIAEASTDNILIDETTGIVTFSLEFDTDLTSDILTGRYIPVFSGSLSINSSDFVNWSENRLLSSGDAQQAMSSETLLPFFIDYLRDGEDQQPVSLSVPVPIINIFVSTLRDIPLVIPFVPSMFDNVPIVFSNAECPDCSVMGNTSFTPSVVNGQVALLHEGIEHEQLTDDLLDDVLYVIIQGTIQDAMQNDYSIEPASDLGLEDPIGFRASAFSGTVFEADDSFFVARLPDTIPPYRLDNIHIANIFSSETSELLTRTVENPLADVPYGYFLGGLQQWQSSGEYSFDFFRSFDKRQAFFGAIVDSTIYANGRYGLAGYDSNPQAWFDTATYPPDAPDVLPFVNFPYFSGDVAYIPDGDTAGINPVLSGGEYQYVSIVRADGVLRQFVRDGNTTFDARLSNDDLLNGRIGAGSEGNRPNDVLWLFGAVVDGDDVRGYSAVAVVTDDDSARVVPPFTEPLLFDRGEAVDLLVLPTGVRAGQVLETGDTFAMIGYLAPTVSADITTTIVTPSETIVNSTQASPFGYFYEPEHDFTVTENGIYTVYVDATYSSETSAGILPEPVYGTVLGAEDNDYLMFVVGRDAPMLSTNRESISTVASGQAFSIGLSAPDTWTDVSGYYVVRTAQQILEQGELDTFSNQMSYTFNWAELARLFPNLEAVATAPSDMDEVTLSFAMTGTDANDNSRTQARIFTLQGNTLYTADE